MREIRLKFKGKLGDFNIYLNSNEEYLFSHGNSSQMKKLLLEQSNGPQGMIVYL